MFYFPAFNRWIKTTPSQRALLKQNNKHVLKALSYSRVLKVDWLKRHVSERNSMRRPTYRTVLIQRQTNTWNLYFNSAHEKIIALFIDTVKLSTLKRQWDYGLIKPLDSCSQFALGLEARHIKYIPLLVYKCKWLTRQTTSNKLIVIKTPSAATDREIKSQHQIQHLIPFSIIKSCQDNNISWNQSHAPTMENLNMLTIDLYLIWHWLNESNKYLAFRVHWKGLIYSCEWQWVKNAIIFPLGLVLVWIVT